MPHSARAPRLSIGLPVHNGAAKLPEAIESLLAQDFADFELVISDNASTDATPDVCASFARLDERIRFDRRPKNIGMARNFDHVLGDTRGELFMWAAHDNRAESSYLRRCVTAIDACPAGVLATADNLMVRLDTGQTWVHGVSDELASTDVVRRVRAILRGGNWNAIYGVIRRAVLDRTRPVSSLSPMPPPGNGPDYRLVELALLGPFVRIAEPLYEYRYREIDPIERLAYRLDPDARFEGVWVGWLLKDLWRMSGRHGLDVGGRLALQLECLTSMRAGGSLHTALTLYNAQLQRTARRDSRWLHLGALLAERCVIGR